MVGNEQRLEIENNIKIVFNAIKNSFYTCNSKKELALITGIHHKKIEYYLKEDVAREYGIPDSEILRSKEWLLKNKIYGLSLGGKHSQEKHGFDKDEKGFFRGSGK